MNKLSENLKIYLFIIGFFIINILQSIYTGLHPDEAYYWMYAKHLDWGYFDHPPLVAIFIKLGLFIHKTLGVRIVTCLAFSISILILWKIVKTYRVKANAFIILFSSILLFHVYGFITTPDAPLFLFSILFLFAYQQFLKKQTIILTIFLGVLAATLLYSKYHGVLLLIFILLSNVSLFKNYRFYLIIIIAIALFSPHIWWQFTHDFPSIQYHLSDRTNSDYKSSFTLEYIANLIIIVGPLTGWYLYYLAFKVKIRQDKFIKSLKFCLYGIILFFLISTIKGRVQAHWPLIAFIELFVLSCIATSKYTSIFRNIIVTRLFISNILLIILARCIIAFPPESIKHVKFIALYSDYEVWTNKIKTKANGLSILFLDGFQKPSLYNFYTQSEQATSYNSIHYRKTQYDYYPLEDSLRNKKIYYITSDKNSNLMQDSIVTSKEILWGSTIEDVQLFQKVNFVVEKPYNYWKTNETKSILFKIENPYDKELNFNISSIKNNLKVNYIIMKDAKIVREDNFSQDFSKLKIKSKNYIYVLLKITAPKDIGEYKFFISIKNDPFPGSRNSRYLKMNVK